MVILSALSIISMFLYQNVYHDLYAVQSQCHSDLDADSLISDCITYRYLLGTLCIVIPSQIFTNVACIRRLHSVGVKMKKCEELKRMGGCIQERFKILECLTGPDEMHCALVSTRIFVCTDKPWLQCRDWMFRFGSILIWTINAIISSATEIAYGRLYYKKTIRYKK